MNTFTLAADLHADFLATKHRDPTQNRLFQPGDRVVFCQRCATPLLYETWLDAGGRHCGQEKTRITFPAKENLRAVGVDWEQLLYPHPAHFEAFVLEPHLRRPLSSRLQARRFQHAQRVLVGLAGFLVLALWNLEGWRGTLWAVGMAGIVLSVVLFVSEKNISFFQKENSAPLPVELYKNGFFSGSKTVAAFVPIQHIQAVQLQLLPAKKGLKQTKLTIFHIGGVSAFPIHTAAYPPLIQALGVWSTHVPVEVTAVCEEVYRFVKHQNLHHGANIQQKNIYA